MKGKLQVRPAVSDDYPAIAALLDRTFEIIPLEKRKKLWDWRNKNNPACDEKIPTFIIAEKEGQIVGVHGLTPMRIKAADNEYLTACSCDLAVDPTARSAGMQIKLKAMSKDISPLHISTSANEPANKITLALGGKEVLSGRRKYLKPLKASGFIRQKIADKAKLPAKIISLLVGKPLDWAMSIGRLFGSFPGVADAEIQNIEQFDQCFDRLWEKVSKDYPILIVRDSSYLNWRYANYPFSGVQSFSLVQSNELLGFAVIHNSIDENGFRFTAILELFMPPGEKGVFEHLLGETIRRASQAGSHYIQVKTAVEEWAELFKHHGFKPLDLNYSPATYKNNTDLPDVFFSEDRNWYISLGDGDFCYFFD